MFVTFQLPVESLAGCLSFLPEPSISEARLKVKRKDVKNAEMQAENPAKNPGLP